MKTILAAALLLGLLVPAPVFAQTVATLGEKSIGTACTYGSVAVIFDTLAQCSATSGSGTFQKAPLFVGQVTSPPYASTACDAAKAGMLQYTASGGFQGCDGTSWVLLGSSSSSNVPNAFSMTFSAWDGTYVYTNIPTITGFSGSLPVQIYQQSYQINVNSSGWVSGSSTITSGSTLQVRIPVSASATPVVLIGSTGKGITTSSFSYIQVTSASYGASACGNNANGNVTSTTQSLCNGTASCTINGANNVYGDTCYGGAKSFIAYWYCTPNIFGAASKSATGGQWDTVTLSCP